MVQITKAIRDTREKRKLSAKFGKKIEYTPQKLETGDWLFEGPTEVLLVECKSLTDLYNSFVKKKGKTGKHLDDQVARMLDWKNYSEYPKEERALWTPKTKEKLGLKLRRVCLAIEGSYVELPLMMRLRTYQHMGVEVVWSEDMEELLVALYSNTLKKKHTPLRRKN